jgi:hypothetical protein
MSRPSRGSERAQQSFGLPPGPTKGQAQQVPSLDRDIRILWRPAPRARLGRMPGRQGLRRHPDRQAATLLERPVVLRPVAHPIARPGYPVAARLIGLVGHRSSRRREKLTPYSRPSLRRSHGSRFAHQGHRVWHPALAGGCPTRTQDWSQLAFKEINESMLIRPNLDQHEVVKASLDRAIDGREMPLW